MGVGEKNMSNLLERLELAGVVSNGIYDCRKWKNNKPLLTELTATELPGFYSTPEKIWHLLTTESRPGCTVCGAKTKFMTVPTGFKQTCSKKCAGLSEERRDKIRQTSILRHGTEHHSQSDSFKARRAKTNLALGYLPGGFGTKENRDAVITKYGVENAAKSDVVRSKILQTMTERYGVENPQQVKSIRDKTSQTQLARYGNIGWNRAKMKETLLAKYGEDSPLKVESIRAKIMETSRERYGTDYPIQNTAVSDKCAIARRLSGRTLKSFTMPSGDIRLVRGFEPQIIEYLLKSDIKEDDIITDIGRIPAIHYTFANKARTYYPSIFIRGQNQLIDVKAGYEWSKNATKNLAKLEAAKDAGFKHFIIIWDNSRNCIKQMIS